MQQFDEQFIDRFMEPLLMRVFTDISSGKENPYLQKLLAGTEVIPLLEDEKKDFVNDYFLKDKTQPFSSTSEEDTAFQNTFLDKLTGLIQSRAKLSGADGTRGAFLPDKEKKFNTETLRNLYDLSYKIAVQFEQDKAAKLIEAKKANGEITEVKASQDHALLEAGRLMVINVKVNVNGVEQYVEQYISEEDARNFAAGPAGKVEVVPFIAAGTPGRAPGMQVMGRNGQTAEQAMASVSATQPAGAAGGSQPKKSTIAGISNDFISAKEAAIGMMMAKYGLVVLGNGFIIDEKTGIAQGKVKDVSGQELIVTVNTNPEVPDVNNPQYKNPQKNDLSFDFTFTGEKKKSFTLNQTDLYQFEPSAGERKPAEFVAFGKKPKIIAEKKTLAIQGGGLPGGTIEATLTTKIQFKKGQKAREISPQEEERMKAATSGARIGAGGQSGGRPTAFTGGGTAPIYSTSPSGQKTVMDKKRAVANQRIPEQPQMMPQPMGGMPVGAGAGAGAPAGPAKGGKGPLLAALATGAPVVGGLGFVFGGATLDSMTQAANAPDSIQSVISFLSHFTHFFT